MAYQLRELESADDVARTHAIVIDSDATVIFSYGPVSGGSLQTLAYAHQLEKPYHVINLTHATRQRTMGEMVRELAGDAGLSSYDDYHATPPLACVLNVAGTRESQASGIHDTVFRLMVEVLIEVNPVCQHIDPVGDAHIPQR